MPSSKSSPPSLAATDQSPAFWWRDPKRLQAEYQEHGSLAAVGRSHGVPASTLKSAWSEHGLPPLTRGSIRAAPTQEGQPDDEWLLKLLKKHKNRADVELLADEADVPPKRVREALERLGHEGYRVAEEDRAVVLHKVPPPTENVHKSLFDGEVYTYGALGDTHLGSKHERLEELELAYDILEEEGITDVYHGGDLVCGSGIFPGQVNEIKLHTYSDQVEYAVANYPKRKGIRTKMIGGNHDLEGDFGKAGANPVVAFANQRDDIDYLGDYHAVTELPQGTRILQLHPKGSMGYAMDYKARKLVEGFEGGRKPNVMLVAHFHRAGWIEPRSVQVLFTACFESGGSFGPRLGLPDPSVGFYIVKMTVADDGSVVMFRPEFRKFFAGRTFSPAKAKRKRAA